MKTKNLTFRLNATDLFRFGVIIDHLNSNGANAQQVDALRLALLLAFEQLQNDKGREADAD
nr:hypothetical protein [uncultured Cohaesibacter sp.]